MGDKAKSSKFEIRNPKEIRNSNDQNNSKFGLDLRFCSVRDSRRIRSESVFQGTKSGKMEDAINCMENRTV